MGVWDNKLACFQLRSRHPHCYIRHIGRVLPQDLWGDQPIAVGQSLYCFLQCQELKGTQMCKGFAYWSHVILQILKFVHSVCQAPCRWKQ